MNVMMKYENHVLPNFFCIGAKRCGTTWLYELLLNHPEIYLCPYIKEINFFNTHFNYNKGLNWYKKFFPKENKAKKYKVIGEINPGYINTKKTSERIQKHLANSYFLIILRNPVDRAISELKFRYKWGIKNLNHDIILKKVYNEGLYFKKIKIWMNNFPKERFLILIFEELMKEPLKSLKNLANFLSIDFNKFDFKLLKKKVNTSNIDLKSHKIYLLARPFYRFLLSKDLIDIFKVIVQLKRILAFVNKKKNKNINSYINTHYKDQVLLVYKENIKEYEKELKDLEEFLGKDLSIWKKSLVNIQRLKNL